MGIDRDDGDERETRVEGMIEEFRVAQARRAKNRQVPAPAPASDPALDPAATPDPPVVGTTTRP